MQEDLKKGDLVIFNPKGVHLLGKDGRLRAVPPKTPAIIVDTLLEAKGVWIMVQNIVSFVDVGLVEKVHIDDAALLRD